MQQIFVARDYKEDEQFRLMQYHSFIRNKNKFDDKKL